MRFESYEIVPLCGHNSPAECKERQAEFWGLFGIDKEGDAYAVGDFSRKSDAEFIRDALIASPP